MILGTMHTIACALPELFLLSENFGPILWGLAEVRTLHPKLGHLGRLPVFEGNELGSNFISCKIAKANPCKTRMTSTIDIARYRKVSFTNHLNLYYLQVLS